VQYDDEIIMLMNDYWHVSGQWRPWLRLRLIRRRMTTR
jgi:hypothetical protein